MYPTTPPRPPSGATTLIDCETCPVRGRHCDDCFVPVLGSIWLAEPVLRPRARHTEPVGVAESVDQPQTTDGRLPLDSDELGAVSAFVRAGLVTPEEAGRATAALGARRSATG